jgi:hypothetical protein
LANANSPRGLIPYRNIVDAYNTGGLGLYYVPSTYATAIYVGDPVIATGAADANGIPVVQLATAGSSDYTLGPMVAIAPGGSNGAVVPVLQNQPVYHVASTSQYILVAHDPNELFWIQEDSVGGSIDTASSGMKNANLVSGTGSTVTGYSGWMLDSSTINTTNTLQLRIMRALQEEDNTVGTASTYGKWLVKINLHSLNNLTGI